MPQKYGTCHSLNSLSAATITPLLNITQAPSKISKIIFCFIFFRSAAQTFESSKTEIFRPNMFLSPATTPDVFRCLLFNYFLYICYLCYLSLTVHIFFASVCTLALYIFVCLYICLCCWNIFC